jgi:hypothetical protein
MRLSRRYQHLPSYAYCLKSGCGWHDEGSGQHAKVEREAAAHATSSGHEVRAVASRQIIYSPAQPAPAAVAAEVTP